MLMECSISGNGMRGLFGWRGASVTILGSSVSDSKIRDFEILEGCKFNGDQTPNPPLLPAIRPDVPMHRRHSEQRPNHGMSEWDYSHVRSFPTHLRNYPSELLSPMYSYEDSPSMSQCLAPSVKTVDFPVDTHAPLSSPVEVQVAGVNEFIGRYPLQVIIVASHCHCIYALWLYWITNTGSCLHSHIFTLANPDPTHLLRLTC